MSAARKLCECGVEFVMVIPGQRRCPRCSCGMGPKSKSAKFAAQRAKVGELPPMVVTGSSSAPAFGFRMTGTPLSQNRAWRTMPGQSGLRKTQECKDWQHKVAEAAAAARPAGWPLDAQYRLAVAFWFERQSADLSNPLKLLEDALQDQRETWNRHCVLIRPGVVYHDDSQIVGYDRMDKFVDPKAPRLEVVVRVLG